MSNIERGYIVTSDPDFLNDENAITPALSRKLQRYHEMAMDGKKSSIPKLLHAIEQHPDNPQLKNYLSVLYAQLELTEKMYEVNRWIIAEHPDYLFGKLNLANEYYLKEEFDKMPLVLGSDMELKALYPDRDTFHINEVLSFFKCAVLYFTAIGDIEQAEIRYAIMQDLAPEAMDTEIANRNIISARITASRQRYTDERKQVISVKTISQDTKIVSQAPTFAHKEIEWLYSHGLYIGKDKLNIILSLPRESLIQDLELVLQDSIVRYGYFKKRSDDFGWDEEKMLFLTHAICLLGELKSQNSIDAIFNILSQSTEYLQFHLGEFITSFLWEPLYKLAVDNLQVFEEFMFIPGVDTYARCTVPDLVAQIALHHPERRDEVINWFRNVITFFLNSKLDDNVIDSDLIGLMICDISDMEGTELLPDIEKLFERGIVSKHICGDWDELSETFINSSDYDLKRKVLPIAERYEEVTSTWAGYNEDERDLDYHYDNYTPPYQMPVIAAPKIGRNAPCPCGSGKKYKKCCINK